MMELQQCDLILLLALVFSGIGCAVVALAVARRRTPPTRMVCLLAATTTITAAQYAIVRSGLRLNFTGSVPRGLYRMMPLAPSAIRPGMLVAVCAPNGAAEIGRERGYLSRGLCPGEVEPLLKMVGATSGDVIDVTRDGVRVNGRRLPNSRALARDRAGRTLTAWPLGRYRLPRGAIWLYADQPRSWDSRYWGPVPVHNIVARVVPLLVEAGGISALRADSRSAVRRASRIASSTGRNHPPPPLLISGFDSLISRRQDNNAPKITRTFSS